MDKNKIVIQQKEYEKGKYEGELKNDKREGKGNMYYINENIYKGEWRDDMTVNGKMVK